MIRRFSDRWWYAETMAGLIVAILTICAMGWGICAYPLRWSDSVNRLNKLEPVVLQNEADIATLKTNTEVIKAEYQDIHEDLLYLRRKADR